MYHIQAHIFDILHHYKYFAIIYNCEIHILDVNAELNCNYIFCIPQRRITLFNNVNILRFYNLFSNCPPYMV